MAAIEKMCEFSGEYVGPDMYSYKYNHIQIKPEFRKLFAGADYELTIEIDEYSWCHKDYYRTYYPDEWTEYEPSFNNSDQFIKWYSKKYKARLVPEYKFTLKVFKPSLLGIVEGEYINFTYNLSATKRKLKRMLKCRKLNIIHVD